MLNSDLEQRCVPDRSWKTTYIEPLRDLPNLGLVFLCLKVLISDQLPFTSLLQIFSLRECYWIVPGENVSYLHRRGENLYLSGTKTLAHNTAFRQRCSLGTG